MALIKPGVAIAQASGSIGGTVFSHNRGGMYIRNRSQPTQPNTPRQQAVKTTMSYLTAYWNNTLTATQRTAWNTYAANVPLINRLGEAKNVTGLNMFVRTNSIALDTGAALIAAAPTTFTLGPTLTPTATLTAANGELVISAFTGTAIPVGGVRVLMQTSLEQNPSINFFKAPFSKFAGRLVLTADLPLTLDTGPAVAVGNKLFIRTAAMFADGRVGVPTITPFLAA